jgi:hypothetical protein
MPAAVVLLVLLAQVAACQPAPEPDDTSPDQVQTSPFSLTSSSLDPDTSTEPPPGNCASYGVLTTSSALATLDFRYDAYVITARESARVIIKSDVIEANPNGYRYGYGYPISMAAIEDGFSLTAYGGQYLQNALETGTAIMDYPVVAGRQYLLVYKTFGTFTPLTYCLTLPSALTVEGRIYAPPEPVPFFPNSTGPITLENPRPDALSRFMPWLSERVSSN